MRKALVLAVCFIGVFSALYISLNNQSTAPTGLLELEPITGSLTILYDNYLFDDMGRAEWGFSCLIETQEMVVLFDTGGEPEVLRHNIEAFDVDVSEIDCIVISHEHWDHVGGLEVILSQNPDIPVYVPDGVPYRVKSSIRSLGGECVEMENATRLCSGIGTTNTLNGPPVEHALIIKTQDGVILVTGCSHPGVNNLAKNAHEIMQENIQFVIGGFHLGGASETVLATICDELEEVGVERISATHCTGDESRQYFRERYGEEFVESGVGYSLEF